MVPRLAGAVVGALALAGALAGCEQGSSWIQTTCQLDDQAPTPCDYDWHSMTGHISYTNLSVGHHKVTITAQRWTIVSKDPDVTKSSPVGTATREWDVVANGS